ncbi:MAG: valine--tRNA ligase [candidate division WWE3 bacterium]|nr:valine--tRNA ligase [candidate division WWE3 bacterium]
MDFPAGPYKPTEIEAALYQEWLDRGVFKADPTSSKPHYSILMPPPNLTGTPHLGHALQQTIMDTVARYKRMRGFDVLFQSGVDHAGIQFQGALENKLKKEKNTTRQSLGRSAFLEEAWKFKAESYAANQKQFKMMGISADWSREVFTLDPKPTFAVYTQFKKFWDEKLIYKGPYIVQWCPRCGTAIEDAEVEYQEKTEKLYYLKYGPFTLATVRPETKFGDTAMAVNPKDERYQKYIGQEFEIETLNGIKKMKVIADDVVDPNFGTGVIKVTPGHSFDDYEIGKRHNLPIVNVINKEGRLTDVTGKYAGMTVMEAREAVLVELKDKGIFVKEEEYTHMVPVCERCKTTIEPIISEEWFVKMRGLADKAIAVINNHEINFYPENMAGVITAWLKDIHDWCISRSLWWGHQIPVWYCEDCNPSHDPYSQKGTIVYVPKDFDDAPKVCPDCQGSKLTREEQVLDTWFSSGLWPLSTQGWPKETPELKAYFPFDFELSGGEIKFLWIARMIMLAEKHANKIPWKNMFFNGMLRDLQGRKFSKSLGNGIDPIDLLNTFGTDVVRAVLTTYAVAGRDGRVNKQLMIERCTNYRNFTNKLWNAARSVSQVEITENKQQTTIESGDDVKMKAEIDRLVKVVTEHYENFNFHLVLEEIYNSFWHVFCDWYIEAVKSRKEEAAHILRESLLTYVKLLHPIMPFVTEKLWRIFNEESDVLMLTVWPE